MPQDITDNRKAGDGLELTINDVKYTFRWCPPGTFTMGSPASEAERNSDEAQHQVTLTCGFWLLETPVTQSMWEGVMGSNPSHFKGSKKLPVEQVSWDDCQDYIQKLNELLAGTPGSPAGYRFSLPTESQWEYACRAGTTTAYHFGDTLSKEQANFDSAVNQTKDVGSYPANAWGLRDMHGNVWEWCLDWYGDYPGGAVTDSTGVVKGSYRVIRGGAWLIVAGHCRSAHRRYVNSSHRDYPLGLRLSLVSSE
jgi:formylglycine-generating enzyme required for sulfatase activity